MPINPFLRADKLLTIVGIIVMISGIIFHKQIEEIVLNPQFATVCGRILIPLLIIFMVMLVVKDILRRKKRSPKE